jgi:hypothetical protein
MNFVEAVIDGKIVQMPIIRIKVRRPKQIKKQKQYEFPDDVWGNIKSFMIRDELEMKNILVGIHTITMDTIFSFSKDTKFKRHLQNETINPNVLNPFWASLSINPTKTKQQIIEYAVYQSYTHFECGNFQGHNLNEYENKAKEIGLSSSRLIFLLRKSLLDYYDNKLIKNQDKQIFKMYKEMLGFK